MTLTAAQLPPSILPLPAAGRCWVGFSGGLDSTVLLHWLLQQRPAWPVRAVHVNHGLSANAADWQRHCEQLCHSLGVELSVITVALNAGAGNLEAQAREARYGAFAQVLAPDDVLLLAHHQDDQAETLLYRLLRGAGARGLAGMAQGRTLGAARLYRPLLNTTRAELEAYAREQGLSWVEDESNTDVRFDRNYLRQRIMPLLRERWPAVSRSLADSAELSRGNDELLGEYAAEDLSRLGQCAVPTGFSLPANALAAMSAPRRHNLLRHWLEARFGQLPSRNALAEIDAQLLSLAAPPSGAEVVVGAVSLRRFQQHLYALSVKQQWQPAPDECSIHWREPDKPLVLPGADALQWQPAAAAGIAGHWLKGEVSIRWRRGGERCRPAGRGHSQSLKKLLQEYQVPTWLRSRVPLVYIDGELAAVADYWVCQAFAAATDQPGWVCRWQWPDAAPRQA